MISGTDYIDIGSSQFKSVEKKGGIYLLAPEFMYNNGCVKVGIAQKLGHRIGFYRSAYAWWTHIFLFGLITTDDKKLMRRIEKEIFKKFADIRVPFGDFKGKSTKRDSEWLIIDPKEIKKVFTGYEKEGLNVIINFSGLKKAPLTNLGIKSMKKIPRGKYLVEFADGSEGKIDGALLKKTVNMPPLKDTMPSWLKWISQAEADEILYNMVKSNTRNQINQQGGIYVYYSQTLQNYVEKKQREARATRFAARQAK